MAAGSSPVSVSAMSTVTCAPGYDATDGMLVLVRPDGYVGMVTDAAERVEEYWTSPHRGPAFHS